MMNKKKILLASVALSVFGLLVLVLSLLTHAAPIFTGDATADFTAADVITIDDSYDVGLPPGAPPFTSGWDMDAVYFDYDHINDTMYIGIDCFVICGDADGDGNPGSAGPWLSGAGGQDWPDLQGSEIFSLLIDPDNDYDGSDASDFEVVVGVGIDMDISLFGTYAFTGTDITAPEDGFGPALPNVTSLYANPSSTAPDLEFSIADFSTLPDANFSPGETFTFQVYLHAGSFEDAGIGEDYLTNVSPVSIAQSAALGDLVWHDLNMDGIQDAGEPGIAGVTVNLYDGVGGFISTTLTDASGYYTFTMLDAGDYYVEFVPPPAYFISPQDQGANDALDSDIDPVTHRTIVTTLDPGERDPTWDAGLYQLASIGDYVWLDADLDGIQDGGESGVAGVTVNLYDGGGALLDTTSTDGAGIYGFTDLTPGDYYVEFVLPAGYVFTLQDQGADDALDSDADPTTGQTIVTTLDAGENDLTWDAGLYQPASIGDYVWLDANLDGIQDGGESGVAGVTVNLYDGGGAFQDTMTTDGAGIYGFTDLMPGDYSVEFVLPAGYAFTLQDQGADDAVDSDADPATGQTIVTTLDPGEHDPTWDAGLYQLASIGDYVWLDVDQDGIQDGGESGIAGVTVNLYDGGGAFQDTTSTDGAGIYGFTDLVPGDYYVEFVLPANYAFSPQDQGADDAVDSDADPATGQTIVTTLDPGEHDPTWDAGMYYLGPAIQITKTVSPATIVPNGPAVDYMLTITNAGDIILNPVRVVDTLDAGLTFVPGSATPAETSVVGQVITWDDVTAGAGLAPGGITQITFQVLATTTLGTYVNYALAEGTHPTGIVTDTADVPVTVVNPSVALDKSVASPGAVGGYITFTIAITNTGPSVIEVLPLYDTFTGDIIYYDGDPRADAIDNVNGTLAWNDLTTYFGNMAPGQVFLVYTVFQITASGDTFTATNMAQTTNGVDEHGNPTNDDDDTVDLINVPTPVELLYFRASQQGPGVLLSWETAAEINHYGFRLLRNSASELASAVEIAFVPSQSYGDAGGASYSFLDTEIQAGQAYTYWLVDVDLNGFETVHGPVAVATGAAVYLPIILK